MKKILKVISICFLLAGCVFLFLAKRENRPYEEAKKDRNELQEIIVLEETEEKNPLERKIDFVSLQEINPDIIGWLFVPETNIDYPILRGATDTEYLYKNYQRKKSKIGSIFTFSDMEKDFSEPHICLFGHNMKRAEMFGELKKYKRETFAKEHSLLYIYTPAYTKEYELFSAYECKKDDITFEHKMEFHDTQYANLFQHMQEKNVLTFLEKQELKQKQIITLSCCSDYHRTVNRMTVHFRGSGKVRVRTE